MTTIKPSHVNRTRIPPLQPKRRRNPPSPFITVSAPHSSCHYPLSPLHRWIHSPSSPGSSTASTSLEAIQREIQQRNLNGTGLGVASASALNYLLPSLCIRRPRGRLADEIGGGMEQEDPTAAAGRARGRCRAVWRQGRAGRLWEEHGGSTKWILYVYVVENIGSSFFV